MTKEIQEKLALSDIKTSEDFKKWTQLLRDKEIQSWTAKDWNKVYEKMDEISVRMDDVALALGKLYRNYRLEPQQLEIIKKAARQAGEWLAKENIDAAKLVPYTTKYLDSSSDDTLRKAAIAVMEKVYLQSLQRDLGRFKQPLYISELRDGVAGEFERYRGISLARPNSDSFLTTAFHESAHAYLQGIGYYYGLGCVEWHNDRPLQLDDDFRKLMRYNYRYYVNLDKQYEEINIKVNELKKKSWFEHIKKVKEIENLYKYVRKDLFKEYHKQPIEKFSEIYGIEAERAFRRASKQISERTALKLAKTLKDECCLDVQPISSYLKDGRIELKYRNVAEDDVEGKLRTMLENVDDELLKSIHVTNDGFVSMIVPGRYFYEKQWKRILKNRDNYAKGLVDKKQLHNAVGKKVKTLFKQSILKKNTGCRCILWFKKLF